ncbi:energy-coupling factor transport system permease protein [Paenibacillus sophorae]|uniref:Energy-coupling factor transport system permease protein n=1 Tax=Paenibacillus sophorae TaxID=1333845 RepID=A0A1H8S1J9_9BACL|nr:energy-coupling factor transporter transmembrane component T [Paenibacillus sophorae]QWU16882.1 energy-coupling factor transporter transmembrane protein EcfT [Paenibacillus sophorae]SEO72417.1 energy-coupling factor transport system permease protein [Paenibacillus sophorae]
MKGVKLGQFMQGDTVVHRLDPRTKIIGCLALTFTVLLKADAFIVLFDAALLVLGFQLAHVPLNRMLRRLRGLWLLLGLSFVLQAVITEGETLLAVHGVTVTREGVIQGGLTVFRLAALLFSSCLLTMTTSPVQLASGLEKLLFPLSRIGIPVHKFAMLISISLRFIPVMSEEVEIVARAQRSRGAPLHSNRLLIRIKSVAAVLLPLLAASLQRAGDLAVAMESRCYWGGAHLSRVQRLRYGRKDCIMFGILGLLILLSACR